MPKGLSGKTYPYKNHAGYPLDCYYIHEIIPVSLEW